MTDEPNEAIASFLQIANELIKNFTEDTGIDEKNEALKFFEYSIDFFPQSAGFFVLPRGLRLGISKKESKMEESITIILCKKMEYLKSELEKLAFEIRYANNRDQFISVSTELEKIIDLVKNEKYNSLKELDYEHWSYLKKLNPNTLFGALFFLILYIIADILIENLVVGG